MLDNKKYLKDVSALYSSANKVKKHIINELDKIDEKYRKLIAEEKKKLSEQLSVINAQLECFGAVINPEEKSVIDGLKDDAPAEKPVSEVNLKIVDTIFPENNEESEEEKKEKEDEENAEDLNDVIQEEKQEMKDLDAEEDADWDEKIQNGELKEVEQPEWTSTDPAEEWPATVEPAQEEENKEEKKEPVLVTDDESGWPEFPAEWK